MHRHLHCKQLYFVYKWKCILSHEKHSQFIKYARKKINKYFFICIFHMQTDCSCIIINCNRGTRVFICNCQYPCRFREEKVSECHCRSIKTDDLFRWCLCLVPMVSFSFYLFLFFSLAICLATIFIKMHEIAMPIQIVLPIEHTHTHTHIYI